ncbi:unnamed protein product [Calicophoron daubneyi]|uniref:Uncharacterized protein n=1 Tax=Calicophoron daubneyi TaxID=300641 RepID=A0AAV2T2Z0_CALDB
MEKKIAFLEKLMSKKIISQLQEANTEQSNLTKTCADLADQLSRLVGRENECTFICDESVDRLCGFESRYAMAVSKYANELMSKFTPSPISFLTDRSLTDRSPDSLGNDSALFDCTESCELARLSDCKRLSILMETKLGADEAVCNSQLNYLKRRVGRVIKESSLERTTVDTAEGAKLLKELEQQCDELAAQLAFYDGMDVREARVSSILASQRDYLERLDKVIQCSAEENTWLRFLTDLIRIQSNECADAVSLLQSAESSIRKLQLDNQTLLDDVSVAFAPKSEQEMDDFARDIAVEQFERTLARVLEKAPLPSDIKKLIGPDPVREQTVLHVLDRLKSRKERDELAIQNDSRKILSYVKRCQEYLKSLKEDFTIPQSDISHPSVPEHSDKVNPDRIRMTFAGLCAPDITERFAAAATELEQLAEEIQKLHREADIAFSL